MHMKAAIYTDIDRMEIRDVKIPDVDDNSVLIRVKSCAVCGSDIRIFHHGNPRVNPPPILGHEISGEIVEVGKNVTGFKKGDRVAVGADIPCGACFFVKQE